MKDTTRPHWLLGGTIGARHLARPACLQLGLALLLYCTFAHRSHAGLKIYFLRHAEAGHNVVEQWKDKPRDQWPSYVGDPDTLTLKGKAQVVSTTARLKKYHFDLIAVSPTPRTRNTVAPYLRETRQKAEIWPELLEFGSLDQQNDFVPLPQPSPDLFKGDAVRLSDSDRDIFTLRKDGQRLFRLGHSPAQKAADRWAVVQKDIELIHKRFAGSNKTILLVSHDHIGCLLLEALTQDKNLLELSLLNNSLSMAEEQPDGHFKLLLLNDRPVH